MNTAIKTSEEYRGTITIYLENGHKIDVPTNDIYKYIEENKLNSTSTYGGNSGSGEPWNDNAEFECVEDVSLFLDREFDEVIEMYYNNVICK